MGQALHWAPSAIGWEGVASPIARPSRPEVVKSLVSQKNNRVELKNGLRRCRPFFVISGTDEPDGSSRNQFSASPVGGSDSTQPEDR
jgi:hypothetical protein